MSLSRITHQMWHDHPFSQGNKTTKEGGLDEQNLKKGGMQYTGGLHKIEG